MANINLLSQQAIQASLNNKHNLAIKLNQDILKINPQNLAAINRLGKSYFLLNDLTRAKKYYRLALTIDPYNLIAKKNISLLKKSKNSIPTHHQSQNNCYEFLEIPGKTQTVALTRLPEQEKICHLKTGQLVKMVLKKRSIRIYVDECYVGALPDDLSLRLIKLINAGNKYKAYIRSIGQKKASLFIKEIRQGKNNKDQVSFPHTLQEN